LNKDHRQLDIKFFTYEIKMFISSDTSVSLAQLQTHILEKYRYQILYRKAWEAKQKAIENVFGCWFDSYNQLPLFMLEL
jgi:hypothetical protein